MACEKKILSDEGYDFLFGDVNVHICVREGKLLFKTGGRTGGMDISWGDLGAVAVCGKMQEWTGGACVSEASGKGGSRLLIVEIQNENHTLKLTRIIQIFKDHPFIRTWGTVENTGIQDALIDGCQLFSIIPESALPLTLFHVEQLSAKYHKEHFRQDEIRLMAGRAPHEIRMGSFPSMHWMPTSCAWFALLTDRPSGWYDESPENGPGMVCGIEFNGKSRVRAWADDCRPYIVSTIDDLAHSVAPGETFEIPGVFFGRFHGDWDEAGYVTQRFTHDHIHPPMPDENYPWVQYNSWAYGQEINEQQQLQVIERCARLGVELVVLDLGWAKRIGEWKPDPVKFPHGLRPLAKKAREYGMKFGVHVALAQCHTQAPAAIEHPDWLIHSKEDYFGAAPICLGHQPCREWLIEELSHLIENEEIDYIVQDGEDMVKLCTRTDHTHGPEDSNYSNSQLGLDVVIQTLRERFPNLVIENCEDGGCMMTYKMASLYHTSITVDNIDTYSTRQGIYGASYPFSLRYSVRYMQDAPTKYTLYSSIFGGPLILMHRVTEWTDTQMEETKDAIILYKQLRQLVRTAKVIHLMPPKYNTPAGGWGWDAIQAVSASKDQSVVMVYRAFGDSMEKNICPRGLDPHDKYRIRFSGGDEELVLTGEVLEKDGVNICLGEQDAQIIFLDKICDSSRTE